MSPRQVGGFQYNVRAARYVDPRGRFVPREQVRRALDAAIDASGRRVRALSDGLRSGGVTLDEWHLAMRSEVKAVHLYNAAAAKGGWGQMTPADYGRVGAVVRGQYAYLDRFAGEIAAGAQALDGRMLQRAEMYAQAGRRTYEDANRLEQRARGMARERNVLGVADHCAGCLAASAMGWVPIGTLPPVGARDCLTKCRCRLEYAA